MCHDGTLLCASCPSLCRCPRGHPRECGHSRCNTLLVAAASLCVGAGVVLGSTGPRTCTGSLTQHPRSTPRRKSSRTRTRTSRGAAVRCLLARGSPRLTRRSGIACPPHLLYCAVQHPRASAAVRDRQDCATGGVEPTSRFVSRQCAPRASPCHNKHGQRRSDWWRCR